MSDEPPRARPYRLPDAPGSVARRITAPSGVLDGSASSRRVIRDLQPELRCLVPKTYQRATPTAPRYYVLNAVPKVVLPLVIAWARRGIHLSHGRYCSPMIGSRKNTGIRHPFETRRARGSPPQSVIKPIRGPPLIASNVPMWSSIPCEGLLSHQCERLPSVTSVRNRDRPRATLARREQYRREIDSHVPLWI